MRLYAYAEQSAEVAGVTKHGAEIRRFAPDVREVVSVGSADAWVFMAPRIQNLPSYIKELCPEGSDDESLQMWREYGGREP